MERVEHITSFVRKNFTSKEGKPEVSCSHEVTPKGNVIVTHTYRVPGSGSKFFNEHRISDSNRSSSDFERDMVNAVGSTLIKEGVFPKGSVSSEDRFWYADSMKKHLDIAHKPLCVVGAGGDSHRPVITIKHNLVNIPSELKVPLKRVVTLHKLADIDNRKLGGMLFGKGRK